MGVWAPVIALTLTAPRPVRGADQLPAYCGSAGSQQSPRLPTTAPPSAVPKVTIERAGRVTVTIVTDQVNGDVSSVARLLLQPGSDGVSLREAITAVNNSGGGYLIDFASALKGQTIKVGPSSLPQVRVPQVTLSGDVDGDGKPDVTIQNSGVTDQNPMGIKIGAGDVTVYAVTVQGFSVGIYVESLAAGQTYANIAIRNNRITAVSVSIIRDGAAAIVLASQSTPDLTRNTWTGTVIKDNIIESDHTGVQFFIWSSGNAVEHTWIAANEFHIVTGSGHSAIGFFVGLNAGTSGNIVRDLNIVDNVIEGNTEIDVIAGEFSSSGNLIENLSISRNRLKSAPSRLNFGIRVAAGYFLSDGNTVRDVQISQNSIDGSAEGVIEIAAGDSGSSGNVAERVNIADNRLVLKNEPGGTFGLTTIWGIGVIAGDTASDWMDPSIRPVVYSQNNVVRNVTVERNSIDGAGSRGVTLDAANAGNQRNVIERVVIRNNTITRIGAGTPPDTTSTYGVSIGGGWGTNDTTGRKTDSNAVRNVTVEHNTIRLTPVTRYTQSAGVGILGGGDGSENAIISDVFIARNDIDPGGLVGINIVGGSGRNGSQSGRNTVIGVQAWCNVVAGPPDPKTQTLQGLKGVSVVGGFHYAAGNKVDQVRLTDNMVAGVLDDYAVVPNLTSDSSGNSVTVLPGGTQGRPSIAAGGVVNAASREVKLATGTWITVFGQNLAPVSRPWWDEDFAGGLLPAALEGVTVRINGKAAYPSFISPTQINVLAPDDSVLGPVQVDVVTSKGASQAVTVDKREVAPAFFSFAAEGGRYLAAVHADGTYVGKVDLLPGAVTLPARPGETILLFGTGFGQTDPPGRLEEVVENPRTLRTLPTIRIGNVIAEVHFAGLIAAGLYQFNVRVPDVADGDQPAQAEIAGVVTQSNVFVSVRKQ